MPFRSKSHTQRMKPKKPAYVVKRPSSHSRGYGSAWRKLRAVVLAHSPLCVQCLKDGRTKLATDLDHIIPREDGGTDEDNNLQPLCHSCHSRKTVTEDGGFGNERKPRQ